MAASGTAITDGPMGAPTPVVSVEHSLGGIPGYTVTETTDENPDRVAAIQRLTWAYLRSALYPADPSWPAARAALMGMPGPPGRIECRDARGHDAGKKITDGPKGPTAP